MKEDLFKQFTEEANQQFLNERYEDFCDEFESIKRDGAKRKMRIKPDKDIFIRTYKLLMAVLCVHNYYRNAAILDNMKFDLLMAKINTYMRPYLNVTSTEGKEK